MRCKKIKSSSCLWRENAKHVLLSPLTVRATAPPILQPPSFALSVRLFAENVNEHGNNQAICLHVANFITVNDLYQPMPTSLCLITTKRIDMGGSDSGGLTQSRARLVPPRPSQRISNRRWLSLIWVGTGLASHLSHVALDCWREKNCGTERAVSRKGEPKKREGEILLAAVTTVGAIYSRPINKAPADSDTQADRGIIFIWYLAKAPLLKRLLSVNDNQLSFD